MLPDNLNKICVYILTLLLAFPISVLLTSSNFTSGGISSDFIWEERKLKKLWIQVECLTSFFGLPFWAAFTLSILLLIIPFWSIWTLSQISHFSACQVQLLNGVGLIVLCLMVVVRWQNTISGRFFLGCIYVLSLDMYVHKIYFFNWVLIVFLIVIFFPKNWQQIWYDLSISLIWNPSAIVYNTHAL